MPRADLPASRQVERRTHDYKRNGTVQLFAALEVHAGRVIHRIEDRHRSREFIAFMNHLLQTYPSGEIHVILDNVITHRSKEVQTWHTKPKHQRVVFHFLPTYSSWLNLIEILFSLVEANVIRRGVFPTKEDLVEKALAYRPLQRGRTTVPLDEDRGRDPAFTQ